jgi:4-carboxymuconolactone decarboxylase
MLCEHGYVESEMTSDEKALKRLREILGSNGTTIVESFRAISPDFANYIVNFCYGDLYTRQGLSDKDRELAAVASLISQGKTGLPLRAHIDGMLNVGWTKKEIVELIIFLIGYIGFPSTVEAIKTMHEVFSARSD